VNRSHLALGLAAADAEEAEKRHRCGKSWFVWMVGT
jgi:hypothetical protein